MSISLNDMRYISRGRPLQIELTSYKLSVLAVAKFIWLKVLVEPPPSHGFSLVSSRPTSAIVTVHKTTTDRERWKEVKDGYTIIDTITLMSQNIVKWVCSYIMGVS